MASVATPTYNPTDNGLIASELLLADSVESPEKLKSAFDLFNNLSSQLAVSYQQLEDKVNQLTSELDVVSEQRLQELTEKEALAYRLETLLNCLPGGVVVLDRHGNILESNPVAESLLQVNINGRPWREVAAACFSPREDDGHELSTITGKRLSVITRSLGNDGQIILLTDQTETRALQAELSRHERLSALGRVVSTLAHQVRTPLASALLYANHLHAASLTENQKQDFSKKLMNRLHYMERQIRDMLLFVKGDIAITDTISLDQIRDTLMEAIEGPIETSGVNCHWQVELNKGDCLCNLDSIVGAVLNLVNNSIQADADTSLTIDMRQDNHTLIITVLDTGPGIQQSDQEQVTEMFYTTKAQGTGIGLSVVKHVAHSHGGELKIENQKPNGLKVSLELPIIKIS